MIDVDPFIVVLASVWIAVLGSGTLVVHRELALLRSRVRIAGGGVPDGLEVGVFAPRPLRFGSASRTVMVFLAGECPPCHAFIGRLGGLANDPRVLVIIRGSGEEARALGEALPPGTRIVDGSEAEELVAAGRVHAEPFALAVEDGLVVGKGYVRDRRDVAALLGEPA